MSEPIAPASALRQLLRGTENVAPSIAATIDPAAPVEPRFIPGCSGCRAPLLMYRSMIGNTQIEETALIGRLFVVALALGLALPAVGAGPPPSIDELDGSTFSVRAKGSEYDLAGGKSKADIAIEWTITKTGADTVSFDVVFGGMIATAYYVDGFLLQAASTGETPPLGGSSTYVAVSGKPGKLKLKGALTLYAAGPGFNVLRVLKVSGKQIIP